MNVLLNFTFAFIATAGFTLIFNVPIKHMFFSAFAGAAGWALFQLIQCAGQSSVIACFAAACLVAALGETFSRLLKEASLVFIIPGIMPLVPGAGLYKTMLTLLQDNLTQTAEVATETLMLTGSIAVGLLLISSFVRALTKIINSIKNTSPLTRRAPYPPTLIFIPTSVASMLLFIIDGRPIASP